MMTFMHSQKNELRPAG